MEMSEAYIGYGKFSSGSGNEAEHRFSRFNGFKLKEKVGIGFGQRNNLTRWKNAVR